MMNWDNHNINYNLLSRFPAEFMVKNLFFPVNEREDYIEVAMVEPDDLLKISLIENYISKSVRAYRAEPEDIEKALKKSNTLTEVLKSRSENFISKKSDVSQEDDEVLTLEKLSEDDDSVIKLFNNILFSAVNRGASDIHIETGEINVRVKFRVDGILHEVMEPLDIAYHQVLITRIKVLSQLDIAERRIPQDGRFSIKIKSKKIDFRVSVLPGIFGENSVIRILDREMIGENMEDLSLKSLGFSKNLRNKIFHYIRQPYGMFLVTGPTGSGKTTTLYAAVNEIKRAEDKIITIEDPVEYQISEIMQIAVNEKKGLTFASGLRSILRHDPDKIMVGEIRDSETAQIAIQSALTGHLVFTTVHANNVFDVLGRFIHMGIDAYSFVSSLNSIVAQRLLRRLCPLCKEHYIPTDEELNHSMIKREQVEKGLYRAVGCKACENLGYSGRFVIAEILELKDEIKEMILAQRTTGEIKSFAKKNGMITLRSNGISKLNEGESSLEELNRVSVIEWI